VFYKSWNLRSHILEVFNLVYFSPCEFHVARLMAWSIFMWASSTLDPFPYYSLILFLHLDFHLSELFHGQFFARINHLFIWILACICIVDEIMFWNLDLFKVIFMDFSMFSWQVDQKLCNKHFHHHPIYLVILKAIRRSLMHPQTPS